MKAEARTDAVIPAAGVGRRMGSATPKQYLCLAGKSVLERTVEIFLNCDRIRRVVIAINKSDTRFSSLPIASDPRVVVCDGGDSRYLSVISALEHSTAPYVAVHDAARPLLSTRDLETVLDYGERDDDGAILALAMADTVKLGDEGRCLRTVPREKLWRALTPQVFKREILLKALRYADSAGQEITDEASAMELSGYKPRLVEARDPNFKITLPQDLMIARSLFGDKTC